MSRVYPYMLYSKELDFNCPRCGKIHYQKDWQPRYNKYMNLDGKLFFQFECRHCYRVIGMVLLEGKLYIWLREWFLSWASLEASFFKREIKSINKLKQSLMAKKINVDVHLNRYNGTSINDKLRMIEGLQAQVKKDREDLISAMRQNIEILENGGYLPEDAGSESDPEIDGDDFSSEELVAGTKSRGRKKQTKAESE